MKDSISHILLLGYSIVMVDWGLFVIRKAFDKNKQMMVSIAGWWFSLLFCFFFPERWVIQEKYGLKGKQWKKEENGFEVSILLLNDCRILVGQLVACTIVMKN